MRDRRRSALATAALAAVLTTLLVLPASSPAASVRTVWGGGSIPCALGSRGAECLMKEGWAMRVMAAGAVYFSQYGPETGDSVWRLDPRGVVDYISPYVQRYADDLRVEEDGSILVTSEPTLNRIRPDRTVTVVAGRPRAFLNPELCTEPDGSCPAAGDGGPATQALFFDCEAIAPDRDGNLYVLDWGAGVLRKIDRATGIIRRVAGKYFQAGTTGNGGSALEATMVRPLKVAVDGGGNVWIADGAGGAVRRIDTAGIITQPATLRYPTGIDVDRWGNVYVDTKLNDQGALSGSLWRIDAGTSALTMIAGSGALAPDGSCHVADHPSDPRQAVFCEPGPLSVDPDGQVYLLNFDGSDYANNRVQRVAFDPIVEGVTPASAPGGREQVVTIRGRYFNSAAGTATLGGVPLKTLSWSATEISALVPAGRQRGAAALAVTNSDGLASAAGPSYTVTD